MTSLIVETLSLMKKNLSFSKEIDEGKDFDKIAQSYSVTPVTSSEPIVEPGWWLEKLFTKKHISFSTGCLIIYIILALPSLFFIPSVLSAPKEFQIGYAASYIGNMTVLIILLPLNVVRKSLQKLIKQINGNLDKKFVAQYTVIQEKDLVSNQTLKPLDQKYHDKYVKPFILRTLNLASKLAFNTKYQIGAGLISASAFAIIFTLRYVAGILPISVFNYWIPIPNPLVANLFLIYSTLTNLFLWFLVGLCSWSLFIVFMISLQVSAQTIEMRPFEKLKELFHPVTNLVLKTSFALAVVVAWSSPCILLWGVLPRSDVVRQSAINLVEALLVIFIPMIVVSLVIPFLSIHLGMERSRQRALFIKAYRLEQLSRNRLKDLHTHLRVQAHLMEDYRLIVENGEWPLSGTQLVEVFGTVLLPIITFLLSRVP